MDAHSLKPIQYLDLLYKPPEVALVEARKVKLRSASTFPGLKPIFSKTITTTSALLAALIAALKPLILYYFTFL